MDVENHHPYEMVLVGAESPLFESIEIHRTVVDEPAQLARMVEQTRVAIAAGQRFSFKPGGFHLMLLNPSTRLEPGQSIPVNLQYSNGMQQQVDFIVRKHVLELEDRGWF